MTGDPMVGAAARIPVSVLTGFLGSGKTTVLNRLVRAPAMRKALVIINEFGSIGIDHDLVAALAGETVVEMASGCLCCTIRGDLVRTLRDAPWRFAREGVCWFDRVVIETTGLADPIPILHTLMVDERIAALYQLDGVIATVDAATGSATLDRQEEAVRQAAVADRLLLTKTDLATPSDAAAIEARLRALNPGAPVLRAANGEVDPDRLFDAGLYDPATKAESVRAWLDVEAHEASHRHHHDHTHPHDVNRHDDHIRSVCLTIDAPLRTAAVERWLDMLMTVASDRVLRVKGILNLVEFPTPMVIHGVQHIFHAPVGLEAWPSDDRRSRIVLITRDLEESALRDTFLSIAVGTGGGYEVHGADGWDVAPTPAPLATESAAW